MSTATLSQNTGFRAKIQHFGRFLSGMVMPNIGAFLAWGLITALFIPTGWTPNENLAKLVGPMIVYLLPLLIGYTGGKTVFGTRGGVVGAVATMGVIIGSDIPMFLGAMIMGPLGGWVIKQFDRMVEGKIKAGFEMLVNNFSAGILGGALAILGRFKNPDISDDLERVGRSPLRKISRQDRFVSPALKLLDLGIEPINIAKAIAAALRFKSDNDKESLELTTFVAAEGVRAALIKYSGLESDSKLIDLVDAAYHQ